MSDVVIIGAGIAGVSTAYSLSVECGVRGVTIVDPRPPLSLTSDKSTESYRNWWPDEPMVGLMNRSIDLLEDRARLSNDFFALNQRGYLFVSGDAATLAGLAQRASRAEALGASSRVLSATELRREHPSLTSEAMGAVHVRRAGWFDAQQLGAWMLDRAISEGASLVRSAVTGIHVDGGEVGGVQLDDGQVIAASAVVDAAGPMAAEVASLAGVDVPLHSELHLKVVFKDHLGVVPRLAPMLIWSDTQILDWSDEERAALAELGRPDLLGELPVFCHGRPEGGVDSPYVVALWEYDRKVMLPTWPLPIDDLYGEVVIRGLSRMLPGLTGYHDALPEVTVDGGYYTKTPENRPLIGPTGPAGFHLIVGLSGFGVMAAAGAGDLLARHITGGALPPYAPAFLHGRYEDPEYLAGNAGLDGGQL